MGFWGHLLLARDNRPLGTLREARAFGQPEHERRLDRGWSVLWVGREPPDLRSALTPVVAATRAPALVAYVLDSDCAAIEALTPSGLRWTGVLKPATAADSYEAVVAQYDGASTAVAGAIRWSREAGLTPSEADLRKALTDEPDFAEEAFDQLLVGLGVPGAAKTT
ncbi:MAG: hypothetical protein M3Z28_08735 [Candidatus Dormibacteraeota bacterium]|nr:hypothetical protein [Candidatus Dormibacteraeota bacterium]